MKHYFISDIQVVPGEDFSYLSYIGMDIANEEPEVIVCIGDFWDFESLSAYDVGKASAEGKRLSEDIKAGNNAMDILMKPIVEKQNKQRRDKKKIWRPRLVFTLGNHEQRLMTYVNNNPNLKDLITYDDLNLKKYGWEIIPFLKPIKINDIWYCHYFGNPMTGRPLGGAVNNIIKQVGGSFCQGHVQKFDFGIVQSPTGTNYYGLVLGAGYLHDEDYKGEYGNKHFRGMAVLDNVIAGTYDLSVRSTINIIDNWS